jgi:putative transposase
VPENRKRRKTFNEPGHAHELTFSTYRRLKLLRSERTCLWFLEALNKARKKHRFHIWAYVIMPEHVHVLIWPLEEKYDMAKILQSIKEGPSKRAKAYLKKHNPAYLSKLRVTWPSGRIEHRFWQQGGGYDRNMFSRAVIRAAIDYIHANPIRGGFVENPEDWKWSSASWHLGKGGPLEVDPLPDILPD